MNSYTEYLNTEAHMISPEDDDYEEKLLRVASMFRGFGEALTAFMTECGYTGAAADAEAKAGFLRERFKNDGIRPPRDFTDWFVQNRKITRRTAFQICFAFRLSVDETREFFRSVQFERGFDCHTVSEAVYYFCISNRLTYSDAQEIISHIPAPQKVRSIPDRDILYTTDITRYIDSIRDKNELISYITEHSSDFRYNNATATGYIRELWHEIAGPNGLAQREGALIANCSNQCETRSGRSGSDMCHTAVMSAGQRMQDADAKSEDYVIAGEGASSWIILSQIFGLRNYQENEYAVQHDRSLASVLSDNKLMPLRADYCFPSRQNIDKLIRGDLVGDDEIVRKMLILLVFYVYWTRLIVGSGDTFYEARVYDSDRCLDTINNRLLCAGYPKLYAGNPYDWLFLWALNDDHPLDTFRFYIGEVFAVKEEQLC